MWTGTWCAAKWLSFVRAIRPFIWVAWVAAPAGQALALPAETAEPQAWALQASHAAPLRAGDEIRTSDQTEADVLLGPGVWIHLSKGGELRIERCESSHHQIFVSAQLAGGKVFVKMRKKSTPSVRLSLHSHSLIAEPQPGRNNSFIFELTPPGLSRLEVLVGRVTATEWREKTGTHEVSRGYSAYLDTGQKAALVMLASLLPPSEMTPEDWSDARAWVRTASWPAWPNTLHVDIPK